MAYTEINATATESIADLMVYTGSVFPGFWPMVLFGLWCILTFGSYFSLQRLRVNADFISCATAGSMVTLAATFFLSMIPGLISIYVMSVSLIVTLICAWVLISSENRL